MASFVTFLSTVTSTILLLIHHSNAQQTTYSYKGEATCGQLVAGRRGRNEFAYYSIRFQQSSTNTHIESCLSDHDTVLYLFNSQGNYVKSADDNNNHPNPAICRNPYAGDLTFDNPVHAGDLFYFGIYGYDASQTGIYAMTVECGGSGSQPQPQPPPAPAPVPQPPPAPAPQPPGNCARHRRPWHTLTQQERNLYISGFKRLAQMGRMRIFTQTHVAPIPEEQAHGSSAFLPWYL